YFCTFLDEKTRKDVREHSKFSLRKLDEKKLKNAVACIVVSREYKLVDNTDKEVRFIALYDKNTIDVLKNIVDKEDNNDTFKNVLRLSCAFELYSTSYAKSNFITTKAHECSYCFQILAELVDKSVIAERLDYRAKYQKKAKARRALELQLIEKQKNETATEIKSEAKSSSTKKKKKK
ncbi:unnamed protein product, partial [marine sediment metagenome]